MNIQRTIASLTLAVFSCSLATSQDGQWSELSGPSRVIGQSRATTKPMGKSDLPQSLQIVASEQGVRVAKDATQPPIGDSNSVVLSLVRSSQSEDLVVEGQATATAGVTRALAATIASESPVALASNIGSLDQLLGQSTFRGESFATPGPNARMLDGRITLRKKRSSEPNADPKLEANDVATSNVVEIVQNGRVLLAFPFPDHQQVLAWSNIPNLPSELAGGLTPGEYRIRFQGSAETAFFIEDTELKEWINEPINRFEAFAGVDNLATQLFRTEYLLAQTDKNGNPTPYVSDVLDVLERLGAEDGYFSVQKQRLYELLELSPKSAVPDKSDLDIDQLRQLIRYGRVAEASKLIEALQATTDPRVLYLTKLYEAVLLSQSSEAMVFEADAATDKFAEVETLLGTVAEADRFRFHINYANYLLSKVQSRVYGFAIQAATQQQYPLMTSLWDWSRAQEHYARAADLATQMSSSDQSVVSMNQARLYCVLADYLRNLNPNPSVIQCIEVAEREAKTYAQSAVALQDSEADVRSAANEVLAHLAYRQQDWEACRKHISESENLYVQIGSLSGLASCYRTIGLVDAANDQAAEAMAAFEASLTVSDLLEMQLGDASSLESKAGFFAKYAYTCERMIESLISKREYAQALEVLEDSKARNFVDQLQKRGSSGEVDAITELQSQQLIDVLDEWDGKTVAVEYFLGSRYAYVFFVDGEGVVTAYPIVDQNGAPIASSDLIGRVVGFLGSIEFTAKKLYQQAVSGRGFDKQWQVDLNDFYSILIPAEIREQMSAAERVVIVPHHVLHYFPFAALVTELDKAERAKFELPQPKFFVESIDSLTQAPSLMAYHYLARSQGVVQSANAVGIGKFENAPNLPGVEQDLKNFREVFGERIKRFVNTQPILESAVVDTLSIPGVLLIGTHGLNDADSPLESFLLCNADSQTDGQIRARELYRADVQAEVVIMSACYSGLADRTPLPGDDLFGLNRGLLHAGANTVIAGLWDVYDDTAPVLVHSTCRNFANGQSIASALTTAQQDFIAARRAKGPKDPWIHPYFWAVYNCTGGGRVVFGK